MDEFSLIARYFAPLAGEGAFALTDDAACIVPPAGKKLVITKDCMVAGVHFIGDEAPAQIARKLLRVNLSDLAAKGAKPYGYLLGLMAPRDTTSDWFAQFAHGLAIDQDIFGLSLLGGDTTATPDRLCLSLTALGTVDTPLLRSGARVGDAVYVTGTLGDAALGLMMQQTDMVRDDTLVERYQLPEPRVSIGLALPAYDIGASMDISDGLLADAAHIAMASRVGIELEAPRLPLSPATRRLLTRDGSTLEHIVTGGDDYELLFTASSEREEALTKLGAEKNVAITRIGRVVEGNAVILRDEDGSAIDFPHKGYRHF